MESSKKKMLLTNYNSLHVNCYSSGSTKTMLMGTDKTLHVHNKTIILKKSAINSNYFQNHMIVREPKSQKLYKMG